MPTLARTRLQGDAQHNALCELMNAVMHHVADEETQLLPPRMGVQTRRRHVHCSKCRALRTRVEVLMQRDSRHPGRLPVLYVEDHPVNAMLMRAIFEHRPRLRLVMAGDCQDALRQARALNPCLLLLDLRLPDCHGSQLLPLLRRIPGCEAVPAVAVTADGAFNLDGTGFAELWPKPIDLDQVLERLDALTQADIAAPAGSPSGMQGC